VAGNTYVMARARSYPWRETGGGKSPDDATGRYSLSGPCLIQHHGEKPEAEQSGADLSALPVATLPL
jgi:hypothetical protein